jgi:glycosyltransferase involved in cell wall biosynthesis/O-antigen/teichoic acid export membrane protein
MSEAAARNLGLATRGGSRAATAAPTPTLLRGIATNIVTIAVGALGVLFTLLVARLLGKAALGGFLLAWATADLLSKVGTLGLDQGTTALVARRRAEGDATGARAVFHLALAAGLGLSALVAGAAWLVLGWLENAHQTPELVTAQRAMLLALPAVALYRIANGASRGLGIMKHDAVSGGLVQNLVKVLALVGFVWAGFPRAIGVIDTAVLAALAGFAAAGLAAYLLARGALPRGAAAAPTSAVARADATALIPLSVAAAAAGLANLAMQRMDVLVLGAFVGRAPGLDAAAFGVYCAAREIAGIARKVGFAAEAPFLHAVATAHGSGRRDEERGVLGDVARWTLPASLFLAAGLALGSPLWLSLFGPGFERGTLLVSLLVVANSVGSYSGLAENVLLLRRPTLNVLNSGVGVVAYVAVCLALVPRMGASGAALAAAAAYGVVASLRFGELRAMGVPWPWERLRGAWLAFFVALGPGLAFRGVLPGRAGAALAVLAFTAVFVAGLLPWAFDDRDREALLAAAPFLRGRSGTSGARRRDRFASAASSVDDVPAPLTVILVVSSENDGGAARSTYLLARDLPRFGLRPVVALHREGQLSRRLAAAGMAFEVVPGLPEDLTHRPGRPASLWAVPGNLRALPGCVSSLRDLAEREGASLLYGQGTWANLLSALAARGSAAGAVWHVRNDFQPGLKRLLMRGVARACAVRAIVAVSGSAASPLEGLPMALHVVENGADLAACDAARDDPDDLRQRLGIPPSAVVACYAGRLLPHKGIHVLMEAARRAMSRNASLHLVILGDNPAHAAGDVRGELAQQAASWGLGERIHLAGWVPAVERALVGLDFVVIPSTCRECGSRSLIESLCLGLPVVASNAGGNPELLRDGEDGLLVPPGDAERLADALLTLASDAALRRRLAEGALAARRRFDSLTVARRAATVLRAAAAGAVPVTKAWEPVSVEP